MLYKLGIHKFLRTKAIFIYILQSFSLKYPFHQKVWPFLTYFLIMLYHYVPHLNVPRVCHAKNTLTFSGVHDEER